MGSLTRRAFLGSLFVPRLAGANSGYKRTYRATARIRLFRIPLLAVKDAGGAEICYQEIRSASGVTQFLSFAAGSEPSRTRGINRLGYMEEAVVQAGGIERSAYFGFMTASREESLEEARKAIEAAPEKTAPFVAIEGHSEDGRHWSKVSVFQVPTPGGWRDYRQIGPLAQRACRASEANVCRSQPGVQNTFLHSVLLAIQSHQERVSQVFCYSKGLYHLETERRPDPREGERLQAIGLTRSPDQVDRIEGRIRTGQRSRTAEFTLWVDRSESDPFPLRFEYWPRAYLGLAFQAEPGIARPRDPGDSWTALFGEPLVRREAPPGCSQVAGLPAS